jgi:hypothetical protein
MQAFNLKEALRALMHTQESPADGALIKQAADEIERLRAEVADMKAKHARCMASRDALRDWAQECRNKVLMPVADRNDDLGITADGLGQCLAAMKETK